MVKIRSIETFKKFKWTGGFHIEVVVIIIAGFTV